MSSYDSNSVFSLTYDGASRLIGADTAGSTNQHPLKLTLKAVSHLDSGSKSYSYDKAGNRISQMAENRNQRTGFSLSSVIRPLSSSGNYTYNAANQLLDDGTYS